MLLRQVSRFSFVLFAPEEDDQKNTHRMECTPLIAARCQQQTCGIRETSCRDFQQDACRSPRKNQDNRYYQRRHDAQLREKMFPFRDSMLRRSSTSTKFTVRSSLDSDSHPCRFSILFMLFSAKFKYLNSFNLPTFSIREHETRKMKT